VLWWGALFPRWNVFDLVYNTFLAARSGRRLEPAPPPRRFAQALASLLSLTIAVSLLFGFRVVAIAVQAVLLSAIALLIFRGFCVGSYVFHLLRGRNAAKTAVPSSGTV
jgi:hypothetical protein